MRKAGLTSSPKEERRVWRSPWGRVPWAGPRVLGPSTGGVPTSNGVVFAFQSVCLFFFFSPPDVYFKHHTLRAYKED